MGATGRTPWQTSMVLADTGYWLALANRRDRWHERAVAVTRSLGDPLVITWPVLTEASHLMASRLGVDAQLLFLEQVAARVEVHEIAASRLLEMRDMMSGYRGLPMDLADASLVLAADDLDDGRILSTDVRDFTTYRWKERRPFRNLLAEA